MSDTTPTMTTAGTAVLERIAGLISDRAVARGSKLHERYAAIRQSNPFADEGWVLDALAREVAAENEALRHDLLACKATIDAVVAGLAHDADRLSRLSSAHDAIWGTAAGTPAALLTARLLDVSEEREARDWLNRTSVARIAERVAAADDVRDRGFVRAIERELLDEHWSNVSPEDAVPLADLKRALAKRRAGRVPEDVRASLEAALKVRAGVAMWTATLAAIPPMSGSHLHDALRRRERDPVRGVSDGSISSQRSLHGHASRTRQRRGAARGCGCDLRALP